MKEPVSQRKIGMGASTFDLRPQPSKRGEDSQRRAFSPWSGVKAII